MLEKFVVKISRIEQTTKTSKFAPLKINLLYGTYKKFPSIHILEYYYITSRI